jgi:hypothetical protein
VAGGAFSLKMSQAAVVGPVAAAGMVVVATPGTAVEVAAVVVDAAAKTAASPPASPAAAGIAATAMEHGSYSAPPPGLRRLLALGSRLPHEGSIVVTEPPRLVLLLVPAAPRGSRLPLLVVLADQDGALLIVLADRDGARVVLVVELRLLPLPDRAGPPWQDPPGL